MDKRAVGRRITICWGLGATLVLHAAVGCRARPYVPVVNPQYLVVRPVETASNRTPQFGVAVEGRDGRTYYISDEVIIDLAGLERGSAYLKPSQMQQGGWTIVLETTSRGGQRLWQWTKAHVAEPIGIFVDGKLLEFAFVREAFGGGIQIEAEPPLSKEEAETIRGRITAGGGFPEGAKHNGQTSR